MNQYFERMKAISASSDLPKRMCFMLEEIVQLRARKVSRSADDVLYL